MMTGLKTILWYGEPPQPGLRTKLDTRGFRLLEEPDRSQIVDGLLAVTTVAVLCHTNDTVDHELQGYRHLPRFIDHGVLVLIVVPRIDDFNRIRTNQLSKIDSSFPWGDQEVLFLTDLIGNNFDTIVAAPIVPKWHACQIRRIGGIEALGEESELLLSRAFPRAEEIHIRELGGGFSKSRVFMAHEKRQGSSIAHWTQPKLVKIGRREKMEREIGNMIAVSPFVPFELRPNLEAYIKGFRKSILIADFVDRSEPLIDVARAGRAETAISNLFNRTLHTWRERAWAIGLVNESLADAAERLDLVSPTKVCEEYLESHQIASKDIDLQALWQVLKEISFEHRAASIHADLHGNNVRVRGDDAILIDLGSVRGTDEYRKGAPLTFDVAMLEVALLFACEPDGKDDKEEFEQKEWETEVRSYYKLAAVFSTPLRDSAPRPDSWMFGCIQRLRSFGIYDQSNKLEYAIALVIAMIRWCSFSSECSRDKGRRVVALDIATDLIAEIEQEWLNRGKS
jgi:hypothetical protein